MLRKHSRRQMSCLVRRQRTAVQKRMDHRYHTCKFLLESMIRTSEFVSLSNTKVSQKTKIEHSTKDFPSSSANSKRHSKGTPRTRNSNLPEEESTPSSHSFGEPTSNTISCPRFESQTITIFQSKGSILNVFIDTRRKRFHPNPCNFGKKRKRKLTREWSPF